jgi:hypothetical protein
MNSKQTAVEWLFLMLNNPNRDQEFANKLLDKAKEIEREQAINTSKINRVEVIQHSEPYNGRAYTNYNAKDVEVQFQDEGETLKIFLK